MRSCFILLPLFVVTNVSAYLVKKEYTGACISDISFFPLLPIQFFRNTSRVLSELYTSIALDCHIPGVVVVTTAVVDLLLLPSPVVARVNRSSHILVTSPLSSSSFLSIVAFPSIAAAAAGCCLNGDDRNCISTLEDGTEIFVMAGFDFFWFAFATDAGATNSNSDFVNGKRLNRFRKKSISIFFFLLLFFEEASSLSSTTSISSTIISSSLFSSSLSSFSRYSSSSSSSSLSSSSSSSSFLFLRIIDNKSCIGFLFSSSFITSSFITSSSLSLPLLLADASSSFSSSFSSVCCCCCLSARRVI